jgi:type II secretory pathway pseudopilin PulG
VKNKVKETKGITLIALVVTIIVLLILAAITISTLTGENGILTKADSANERTKQEQAIEEVKLAYNAVQIDVVIDGWDIDKKAEELQKELRKEDSTSTVTVDGTDLDVTYKGYDMTINEKGNVTIDASGATGDGVETKEMAIIDNDSLSCALGLIRGPNLIFSSQALPGGLVDIPLDDFCYSESLELTGEVALGQVILMDAGYWPFALDVSQDQDGSCVVFFEGEFDYDLDTGEDGGEVCYVQPLSDSGVTRIVVTSGSENVVLALGENAGGLFYDMEFRGCEF